MNTDKDRMISQYEYIQRQLRAHRPESPGIAIGLGRTVQETTRLVSDFGRQIFLLSGLALLILIIAAAATGNQTFNEFVAWTGWFSN